MTTCRRCGRPLRRPAVDRLGPICRRRARAADGPHAGLPVARGARQPTLGQLTFPEQEFTP
ncbi:hypothetical protein ABZZ74_47595 [Streptomyces sp. NPDC006476]|uniref:hypothetical protein n=1 Tax=Streptomyces sp. NPDC006476 TaxID=3157175 RepID=UPI0033AD0D5C